MTKIEIAKRCEEILESIYDLSEIRIALGLLYSDIIDSFTCEESDQYIKKYPMKCPTCHTNPSTEAHPCPYAQDVNNNSKEDYCICCNECVAQCALDI